MAQPVFAGEPVDFQLPHLGHQLRTRELVATFNKGQIGCGGFQHVRQINRPDTVGKFGKGFCIGRSGAGMAFGIVIHVLTAQRHLGRGLVIAGNIGNPNPARRHWTARGRSQINTLFGHQFQRRGAVFATARRPARGRGAAGAHDLCQVFAIGLGPFGGVFGKVGTGVFFRLGRGDGGAQMLDRAAAAGAVTVAQLMVRFGQDAVHIVLGPLIKQATAAQGRGLIEICGPGLDRGLGLNLVIEAAQIVIFLRIDIGIGHIAVLAPIVAFAQIGVQIIPIFVLDIFVDLGFQSSEFVLQLGLVLGAKRAVAKRIGQLGVSGNCLFFVVLILDIEIVIGLKRTIFNGLVKIRALDLDHTGPVARGGGTVGLGDRGLVDVAGLVGRIVIVQIGVQIGANRFDRGVDLIQLGGQVVSVAINLGGVILGQFILSVGEQAVGPVKIAIQILGGGTKVIRKIGSQILFKSGFLIVGQIGVKIFGMLVFGKVGHCDGFAILGDHIANTLQLGSDGIGVGMRGRGGCSAGDGDHAVATGGNRVGPIGTVRSIRSTGGGRILHVATDGGGYLSRNARGFGAGRGDGDAIAQAAGRFGHHIAGDQIGSVIAVVLRRVQNGVGHRRGIIQIRSIQTGIVHRSRQNIVITQGRLIQIGRVQV